MQCMNKSHIKAIDHKKPGGIYLHGTFTPDSGGQEIPFSIRDNHVLFDDIRWKSLQETDRLALFNEILGIYRAQSTKDCGLFSSALGITTKGNIYIAYNSNEVDQTSKNCAEANLSTIMDLLTKNQGKFETIYMMAGLNGKHEHLDQHELEDPVLPCGRCSDILEAHTTKDATLYALPANNGKAALTLNDTATTQEEVKKGEAWKLPIHDVLLKYREIMLDEEKANIQKSGWADMVGKREERTEKLTERRSINVMELVRKALAEPASLTPDESHLMALIAKAAENAVYKRDSVAEIDADPTLAGINRHLVGQIHLANDHRAPDDNRVIRCAVLRFADGTFASAAEIIGHGDNATPTAEFTAISAHRITAQPITDVWVMEAKKEDIDAEKMHTSAKQSIERAFKRRPQTVVQDFAGKDITKNINLHFIPFNSGKLTSKEVQDIMFSPATKEIYISQYIGSMQMKANGIGTNDGGCCPGH